MKIGIMVTAVGEVLRDVILAHDRNGKVIYSFRLICDRGYKEKDVLDCMAFAPILDNEYMKGYLEQGKMVRVKGRLQSKLFVNKEGKKTSGWNLIVSTVELIDKI